MFNVGGTLVEQALDNIRQKRFSTNILKNIVNTMLIFVLFANLPRKDITKKI